MKESTNKESMVCPKCGGQVYWGQNKKGEDGMVRCPMAWYGCGRNYKISDLLLQSEDKSPSK